MVNDGLELCSQTGQKERGKHWSLFRCRTSKPTTHVLCSSRLFRLRDCSRGDTYCSPCLLIRHCFHCYSHLWAHEFPVGTLVWTQRKWFLLILCSQESRLEVRWIQSLFFLLHAFSCLPQVSPPYILSKSWVNVSSKSDTDYPYLLGPMDFQNTDLWQEYLPISLEN